MLLISDSRVLWFYFNTTTTLKDFDIKPISAECQTEFLTLDILIPRKNIAVYICSHSLYFFIVIENITTVNVCSTDLFSPLSLKLYYISY